MNITLTNLVTVLLVVGVVIGQYFSYRRASSSRERRFVILTSLANFVFLSAFLAVLLLFHITHPMIFIPFVFILFAGNAYLHRQGIKIQREEQTQ